MKGFNYLYLCSSLLSYSAMAANFVPCNENKNLESLLKKETVRVIVNQDLVVPRGALLFSSKNFYIAFESYEDELRLIPVESKFILETTKGVYKTQEIYLKKNDLNVEALSVPANASPYQAMSRNGHMMTFYKFKSGKTIKELSSLLRNYFYFECKQK